MEKLPLKFRSITNALQALKRAINAYERSHGPHAEIEYNKKIFDTSEEFLHSIRDSLIKRFEFCIDSLWKYEKDYLTLVQKNILELNTPRSVFRTLCSAGIINESESTQVLHMLDCRNLAAHIYREEFALQLCKEIPAFYTLMHKIVLATAPK